MTRRNSEFLPQTDILGVADRHERTVVDALYVQYMYVFTSSLDLQEIDRDSYMQALGEIRALEDLLKSWKRPDLIVRLKQMANIRLQHPRSGQ